MRIFSTSIKTRANAAFPQSSQSGRQMYKEYDEVAYQRSKTAMRQEFPTLLFLTGYTNTKLTGKYALTPERTQKTRQVDSCLVGWSKIGNVCLCGSTSEVNSELAGFALQISFYGMRKRRYSCVNKVHPFLSTTWVNKNSACNRGRSYF